MKQSHHPLLTELPAFRPQSDNITVIIETPKGNRNKFNYDPEANVFELKKTLPVGQVFPYDFGFIPSTLGEDGDPVDVLVLMDAPGVAGCLVEGRLIGVIQAEQSEEGKMLRNDRLLAVAAHGHEYEHVK